MEKIQNNVNEIDADLTTAEEDIEVLQGKNTSGDRSILMDTFSRADVAAGGDLGSPEVGAGGVPWKCYDVSPWPPGATTITAAAVNAGGSSYVVGDVLTISGGSYTTQGKVQVSAVDGSGAVAGLTVHTAGAYYSEPSNPVSTTGGSGTGCTVDLTLTDAAAIHQYAKIVDGAFRTTIGQTTYLVRDLDYAPNVISAEIEFIDGNDLGAPDAATFAIACGTKETGSRTSTMIHCTINKAAMTIQTGFYTSPGTGSTLKTHATRPFVSGQIENDTRYKIVFSFDDGKATLRVGEFSITADHPDIARWQGSAVYWEHYFPLGTTLSSTDLKIHSVSCEAGLGAGPQFASKTGLPVLRRDKALIFYGSTDRVTVDMSALTTLTATDYSVFWRGNVPSNMRELGGAWMGLWHFSGDSGGDQVGDGPALQLNGTFAATDAWKVEYKLYNVGDYREQWYVYEPQGRLSANKIDFIATRDITTQGKAELAIRSSNVVKRRGPAWARTDSATQLDHHWNRARSSSLQIIGASESQYRAWPAPQLSSKIDQRIAFQKRDPDLAE